MSEAYRRRIFVAAVIANLFLPPLHLRAQEIPNYRSVVQEVRDSGQFDLSSHDGVCLFTQEVAIRLHALDPNFGHVKKRRPQNGCYQSGEPGHAVDAVLYRSAGKTVDILQDAGGLSRVQWIVNEDDDYPPSAWFAPAGVPLPDPGPIVPDLGMRLAALEARVAQLEATTQAGFDLVIATQADHTLLLESHTQKLESLQAEHSRLITEPPRKSIWARIFGWIF